MSQPKIPILDLKTQYRSLQAEIQAAITQVCESGEFILGTEVKLFEQEVAAYLGVKHAVGCNSGTDALVIGLRAMGIGPGDEVITTPFSFFATAESISIVGATPVFVDIAPDSLNINPDQIEALITERTRAIMPVHLFGNPAAMSRILEIARTHHLKVIEDCAQSFGAIYSGSCQGCDGECGSEIRTAITGKYTGTIGDIGAFSFFPTKNLGAYGDGGLIVTNDDTLANLAQMLRMHGSKQKYQNEILGYNSRLDSIQAAILRIKLPHLDRWNQARRHVAQTYNTLFADTPHIVTPTITQGHVFHQYTLRITNGQRDFVHQELAAQGISTMIYYPIPQDRLPVYKGQYPPNPISDQMAEQVLSLPIWPELDEATMQRVAQAVIACLKNS